MLFSWTGLYIFLKKESLFKEFVGNCKEIFIMYSVSFFGHVCSSQISLLDWPNNQSAHKPPQALVNFPQIRNLQTSLGQLFVAKPIFKNSEYFFGFSSLLWRLHHHMSSHGNAHSNWWKGFDPKLKLKASLLLLLQMNF